MNGEIIDFLMGHARKEPVSFHMPGHKGSKIYRENGYSEFLDMIMDCDITEIPGADNLFQQEGIIDAAMKKYEELYGVRKSYLLVNGSSCGLIAAIMTATKPGNKIIAARNCHKSVFNGFSISGAEPVYAYPNINKEYGITGEISVDEIIRLLEQNPETDAVILPSPNYYGICSDIEAIAQEVHRRNKILIVDQAHGAHLKFFEKHCGESGFPKSAESCGADIVINSTHKTLASFTQTAILNVCTERVDLNTLEDKLQIMESTSPSYPMMASLEINSRLLICEGKTLIKRWADNIEYFYEKASEIQGLKVMQADRLDRTKINIDMSAYGINGNRLEEMLMEKGIFIELVSGNMVMCMTGIGNVRADYDRLLEALREIAACREIVVSESEPKQPKALVKIFEKKAIPTEKVCVPLESAAGLVCAQSIIPYPPGIPIICPGEVLDEELIDYIIERRCEKEKVIGVDKDGMVMVGKDLL